RAAGMGMPRVLRVGVPGGMPGMGMPVVVMLVVVVMFVPGHDARRRIACREAPHAGMLNPASYRRSLGVQSYPRCSSDSNIEALCDRSRQNARDRPGYPCRNAVKFNAL